MFPFWPRGILAKTDLLHFKGAKSCFRMGCKVMEKSVEQRGGGTEEGMFEVETSLLTIDAHKKGCNENESSRGKDNASRLLGK